jgi:hypothetical protein
MQILAFSIQQSAISSQHSAKAKILRGYSSVIDVVVIFFEAPLFPKSDC